MALGARVAAVEDGNSKDPSGSVPKRGSTSESLPWWKVMLLPVAVGLCLALTWATKPGTLHTPRRAEDFTVRNLRPNTSQVDPTGLNLEAPFLQNASLSARQLRKESKSRKQLRMALCGLNGIQAIVTPGQIATNLHNVAEACRAPYPGNPSRQDFCAAMVSLNLALWGFLGIYIEGSVIACSPDVNVHAACAIDLTGLLASTAVTASAGANIRRNCPPPGGYKGSSVQEQLSQEVAKILSANQLNATRDHVRQRAQAVVEAEQRLQAKFSAGLGFRRLEDLAKLPPNPATSGQRVLADDFGELEKRAKEALHKVADAGTAHRNQEGDSGLPAPSQERSILDAETVQQYNENETERNWKRAACFFDLSKATARVAEVAVLAASAAEDCEPMHLAATGIRGKLQCIIDITGAIASASIATTLISLSTVNCPATLQFSATLEQRLCTAAISNVVTVASYMTTSTATLQSACGSLADEAAQRGTSPRTALVSPRADPQQAGGSTGQVDQSLRDP